ncbi:MAG: ATP:cob(I)alamin adenosyltransferase [Thalassobius sp.]|nr:ATP:cob(I)alamin adenosyltransferase [Thalassovita sp.]
MKVYTKTGDKGSTSLLGGERVSKANVRIDAYGTVDELNSFIGLLRDFSTDNTERKQLLIHIQENLFTIGSILATAPGKKFNIPDVEDSDILELENEMDKMDAELPPLKNFILPGGHQNVSYCHIARTICRRAERKSIELAANEEVDERIIKYLNRLSDYLFVLSRKVSLELNAEEIPWKPR